MLKLITRSYSTLVAKTKPFESCRLNLQDYISNKEWLNVLDNEFKKAYFIEINKKLNENYLNKVIYPKKEEIFRALNATSLSKVKVVILGQDPYHNGQATGLAFSVLKGTKIPASLKNILIEIKNDVSNFERDPKVGGCLDSWAKQGVLLLNSILTVEANKASSHSKLGWQLLTDKIISTISSDKENCVFLLWGEYAKKKEELVDVSKHKIIKCGHPSPFSASKFFNSRCFSKANDYLVSMGKAPIDWSLKE